MLQPGDMLGDKYRIKGVIGEGSFGRVYRAEEVALGRDVAIKELLRGEGELGSSDYAQFSERFRREARVQAQFNHPNIVHVYELLEPEPGTMYLAMEYVNGPSLRDYLAERGPLPVDEAVGISSDILQGLAAVHSHAWAIVHRDVKPSNILLTAQGEPKLADFGLAQVLDESMRSQRGESHPGTQAYMSPEQAETTAYLYPPSDLFSVGCILFEMSTGVPYRQAQHSGKSLRELRADAPAWLDEVVAKALAENSRQRHQTAEELAVALTPPSPVRSAEARPDPPPRKMPVWGWGCAGAAGLGAAAGGGAVLSNVLSRREFLKEALVAATAVATAPSTLTTTLVSPDPGATPRPTETLPRPGPTETSRLAEAPTPTKAPTNTTVPAAEAGSRPLTPAFYQWIIDLHPGIDQVNGDFPGGVNFQIAPVEGFDVARFVAEAKNGESTWDVYVGMTPFVEMASLIKSGVIEPWDNYIPKDILDDFIPSIRDECTVDGKLYSWPFLLDVIVQAYNGSITDKAGVPDRPPATWDEFLANSKTVVDVEAAIHGCTFDAHGWRSLCPITHTINTDTYYMLEGDYSGMPLYDFTSEPAVQALEIMKQMLDLSSANALQPGTTDGGFNQTPDEVAFAAQRVAYYIKYQNAPLRLANNWDDPTALRMAGLPRSEGGEGATVFWTTGSCLFKHGQNKEKAAEYVASLTYDPQIWKDSLGGSASGQPGQLPPYSSVYAGWAEEQPDWLAKEATWVALVRGQLDVAKAIPNHAWGLQQFIIGQPLWEKYLKGEVGDPMVAMQEAKDAVAAEVLRVG